MENPVPIFILFAVVAVAFIVVGQWMAAKRRKELSMWALSKGLNFRQGRDRGFERRFSFSVLSQGSNRYAHNIITGTHEGHEWTAFDYHYETHSRDSKGRRRTHHHRFSALGIDLPWEVKDLNIRPEGFFDKITEFFGMDDIDFESGEFSRKFHVKAGDRKWAFDVLHARAIQFLLDHKRHKIEFKGRQVLIRESSGTFSIPDLEEADTVIRGLLDMLPDYVLNELRGD